MKFKFGLRPFYLLAGIVCVALVQLSYNPTSAKTVWGADIFFTILSIVLCFWPEK
jgi:uncharacterized membrane protein